MSKCNGNINRSEETGRFTSLYTERTDQTDEQSAHYLGLLATDGWLSADLRQVGIQLNDLDVIENMAKIFIKEPYHIVLPKSRGNQQQSYRLLCKLPDLYSKCLDFGLTPAKTSTLKVNLSGKSSTFLRYFLRGVIDGDGTVITELSNEGMHKNSISFCTSSFIFAEEVFNLIPLAKLYTNNKRAHQNYDSHVVSWAGSSGIALSQCLPTDSFCMM